ncbi:motility associated factor glycosyltransferase family protein [Anaeroselena agilis]|uniref:DUF115 domain-containing protein n=1 Tax=Anaeroselena agilis TaxID=3063788 RepID=A0ABU3P5V0_9FIRM|nr:DUF115 domain-containing protein [Selenomonadales bacterium 4137-cl]
MSLYADNLAFIAKHNPAVYRALAADAGDGADSADYLPESDNFIVRRNGMQILLHSEFDREREFDRLLQPVGEADKTVVIFGLGNGQVLQALRRRHPAVEHLVVIEPNVEIMRSFLAKHDFVESFSVFNKVSFVVGQSPEEARKMLEGLVLSLTFAEKKMAFIAPIAYRTLYADYHGLLVQGTLEAIRFHRVNKNTLESFRLHWLINDWRNLRHVSPDVGVFRDTFAGWPAVIVSAGPSLKKNMHLLPEVKKRALVIAVGSAISILDAHGIVPHFRIAVDATVENRPLFEKIDTAACPLLYNDHLFHEILPGYKGARVQMTTTNNDTLVPLIFSRAKISSLPVRSGFSVANIALYLLVQLRCSTIVLMGQDLCYTRGKLHAEGSWDEEIEDRYIRKQIETVDILGNQVYTDKTFIGMKKIFESIIADSPEVKYFNATEGGLAIEGAENVALADLLAGPLAEPRPVTSTIETILAAENANLPAKAEKIAASVEGIAGEVAKIIEYCRSVDRQYIKVHQLVETGVNRDRVMAETKKLRTLVAKLDKVEYYAKVVKPVFAERFEIRRGAMDYKNDDWRRQWSGEIGLLRLEMQEIQEYVLRTQALIEEYQGKRRLNIVFE